MTDYNITNQRKAAPDQIRRGFFIGADAEHDSIPSDRTSYQPRKEKPRSKKIAPAIPRGGRRKRPLACSPGLCRSIVRRPGVCRGSRRVCFCGPFVCCAGPLPSLVLCGSLRSPPGPLRLGRPVASPRSSGRRFCPSRRPFCASCGGVWRGSAASAHKVPPPPRD